MAFSRFEVKARKKGEAAKNADYIHGQGKFNDKFSEENNLSTREVLELSRRNKYEICEKMGSGNIPNEFVDDKEFWKSADDNERKNGTVCLEHLINLPIELDKQQRINLVEEWIKEEITANDFPYSYAIHNVKKRNSKGEESEQPHVHLMFSERKNDGLERKKGVFFKRYNSKNEEKGGSKKVNSGISKMQMKLNLEEQRERWEVMCNRHLELANSLSRVSMLRDTTRAKHEFYDSKNLENEHLKTLDFDIDEAIATVRNENDKTIIATAERANRAIDNNKYRVGGCEQFIEFSDLFIERTDREIAESEQYAEVTNRDIERREREIEPTTTKRTEQGQGQDMGRGTGGIGDSLSSERAREAVETENIRADEHIRKSVTQTRVILGGPS